MLTIEQSSIEQSSSTKDADLHPATVSINWENFVFGRISQDSLASLEDTFPKNVLHLVVYQFDPSAHNSEEGGQIPKSWDCCGYTDDPDDTDTESSCPSLAVVHLYKTVMAQFRDRHPSWSDATPFSVTDALFRSVMYVLRHEPELKVQPGYSIQFEYDPNGELKEYMRDRITALEESRIMYSIFTSLARAQVTAECSFPPLPAVKSEGDDVESQCYTLTCVP
ncbi:hypothetical protein M231_04965 [Tremella mesenterica]|uniref:Uncharacterized protein n=1 Tax=Tremella mesenterica TaxID=5217 RepID=A0A4Q1BJB2_TREME|nr:hypothetical protein M231_04965 [Tremella mesenterica]